MSKVRKVIAAICVVYALAYTATVLIMTKVPPKPENYKSAYTFGELQPMQCFTPDSVFNVGSAKELDEFPNIGKVLSQRIVEYREIWGDYRIPEDLTLVKGIGEKTMDGILEVLEEPLVPKMPWE